ncbi:MAG: response regulator [Caldilineaceae bacterium]
MGDPPPDPQSPVPNPQSMNELILVVDDEPKIIRLARDYLEGSGFSALPAMDGNTALAAARTDKPDLVVLDLNLPGMDGLDVCRALRRESSVPIIMLTARADETDRLIGLELGADDYIVKPFSPRELVARCAPSCVAPKVTCRRPISSRSAIWRSISTVTVSAAAAKASASPASSSTCLPSSPNILGRPSAAPS